MINELYTYVYTYIDNCKNKPSIYIIVYNTYIYIQLAIYNVDVCTHLYICIYVHT